MWINILPSTLTVCGLHFLCVRSCFSSVPILLAHSNFLAWGPVCSFMAQSSLFGQKKPVLMCCSEVYLNLSEYNFIPSSTIEVWLVSASAKCQNKHFGIDDLLNPKICFDRDHENSLFFKPPGPQSFHQPLHHSKKIL